MAFTKANRTVLDLNKATVDLPTEPYQLANKKYVDDKLQGNVPANVEIRVISSVSTANQTSVLTTPYSYRVGTNSVTVYADGVYQIPGQAWQETGLSNQLSSSIVFTSPLSAGIKLTVIIMNTGELAGGGTEMDDLTDVDMNSTLTSVPSNGRVLVLDGATWKPLNASALAPSYAAGYGLTLSGTTFSIKTSQVGGLDERYAQHNTLSNYALKSHEHDGSDGGVNYMRTTDTWTLTQWINAHDWDWRYLTGLISSYPSTDELNSQPLQRGPARQYVRQMFPGGFFVETGVITGSTINGTYTPGKYYPKGNGTAGDKVYVVMNFMAQDWSENENAPQPISVSMAPDSLTKWNQGQIAPVWEWQPANRKVAYIAVGFVKNGYETPSNTVLYPSNARNLQGQKYLYNSTLPAMYPY